MNRSIAAIFLLRLCIFLGLCYGTMAWDGQVGISQDELRLFTLLNQERDKAGLPRFQWDYHLAQSARAHAQRLAEHEQLSHQFEGEPPLIDRVGSTGARFDSAAENVALAPTVEEAHHGLMESPPHHANIMNPQYNAVGLGIVARQGELYVAQNFAHILPVYSEAQFRDAVAAAFNQFRQTKGVAAIEVRADPRLHDAACTANADAQKLIQSLPGVTDLVVFTASVPEKLPSEMQRAARDFTLKRMNLGVCFKPGEQHGFASFWVAAAFFPVAAS